MNKPFKNLEDYFNSVYFVVVVLSLTHSVAIFHPFGIHMLFISMWA